MKQKKVNNSIGLKYYKYIGDELKIIRIARYYNSNQLLVLNEDGSKSLISNNELNTYMKLNSDGIVIFNIVNLGDYEDVMITLHRRSDIKQQKIFPYMVCRQNIRDVFDYTLKGNWGETPLGMCVSEETMPQGYDYKSLFKVSSVIETQSVNVYIDDDLDTILQFVKHNNINSTLCKLKAEFESLKYVTSAGACSTLTELLKLNDFMLDFDRAYNIIKLDFDLASDIEEHMLNTDALKQFIDKTSLYIIPQNTFLIDYDKTIDLNKIEEKYKLLKDKNNKLYVMLYRDDVEILPSYAAEHMDILQRYKLV